MKEKSVQEIYDEFHHIWLESGLWRTISFKDFILKLAEIFKKQNRETKTTKQVPRTKKENKEEKKKVPWKKEKALPN